MIKNYVYRGTGADENPETSRWTMPPLSETRDLARKQARNRARSRALETLARKHPAEFIELHEAELKAAELLPFLPSGPKPRLGVAS